MLDVVTSMDLLALTGTLHHQQRTVLHLYLWAPGEELGRLTSLEMPGKSRLIDVSRKLKINAEH